MERGAALGRLAEVVELVRHGRGLGRRVLVDRTAVLDRLGALARELGSEPNAVHPVVKEAADHAERSLAEVEAVLQRVSAVVARSRPDPPDAETAEVFAELEQVLLRSLAAINRARNRLHDESGALGRRGLRDALGEE